MYKVLKRVMLNGEMGDKVIFETNDKSKLKIWLDGYLSAYPEEDIRIQSYPNPSDLWKDDNQIILG